MAKVIEVLKLEYEPQTLRVRRTSEQQLIGLLTTLAFVVAHLVFIIPYGVFVATRLRWMLDAASTLVDTLGTEMLIEAAVWIAIAIVALASLGTVLRQVVFLIAYGERPFVFSQAAGSVLRGRTPIGSMVDIQMLFVREARKVGWHRYIVTLRMKNGKTYDIVDHLSGFDSRGRAQDVVDAIGSFVGLAPITPVGIQ